MGLIKGLDSGGAQRAIVVDDNGNLRVDLVSGISVSTEIKSSTTLTVDQLSGSAWSTSATIVGSSASQTVVGDDVSDAADTGGAPIKVGGIARQANPTAVAAGDRVSATYDDLGRQVITPYQVRDLVKTAYVALANGTETPLLAGVAGTLHDVAHVICANTSDAAISIDFRSGTAGSVVFSVSAPANGMGKYAPVVPVPQTEAHQAWTADMGDYSNTTVNISGLFITNV